jgi:hypothetical protein
MTAAPLSPSSRGSAAVFEIKIQGGSPASSDILEVFKQMSFLSSVLAGFATADINSKY